MMKNFVTPCAGCDPLARRIFADFGFFRMSGFSGLAEVGFLARL
jgi:hypothetical protein